MKKTRIYTWKNREGKEQSLSVNYSLVVTGGKLTRVINQHGFACEENSEVFDYFNKNL